MTATDEQKQNLLKLDLSVIRALAAGRSSSQLLARWPAAVRPDGCKIPPPDKATISRWLNSVTFPRSRDELFGLAGALGVDPLAVLRLSPEVKWMNLCDAVRSYNWTPRLAPAVQRFWFLRELIEPNLDWPSAEIARQYFGCAWQWQHKQHRRSIRRNFYGSFILTPDPSQPVQVWHFAWRPNSGSPWRPYGFVRMEQNCFHAYAFDGREGLAKRENNGSFAVETWFGSGDADFCVASLHKNEPFQGEYKDEHMPKVRFVKTPFRLPRL